MQYDYYEATTNNVLEYIEENINFSDFENREELEEKLYDDCWISDSVTGNASGSYTCNTWQAEEYLAHNWDILADAINEFCCDCNPIEKGAEYFDVTIRCYILTTCIVNALDILEEANENLFAEA